MANRKLGTRQKMVFRLEPGQSKPRNPFAVAASQRTAGAHRPSNGALRALHKRQLKKWEPEE